MPFFEPCYRHVVSIPEVSLHSAMVCARGIDMNFYQTDLSRIRHGIYSFSSVTPLSKLNAPLIGVGPCERETRNTSGTYPPTNLYHERG
jgi:hypothetical protein